jgi:predicted site-specific integrase-resolvase
MPEELLAAKDAANRLGVARPTLYDWLGQSDCGLLLIRGQRVTIDYFQGGAQGQGRIRISADEVERIKSMTRVRPRSLCIRRPPRRERRYPGITVPLGRPAS